MTRLWDFGLRTPNTLAVILATIALCSPFSAVQALRTAPGSPCSNKCDRFGPTTNTTGKEIVCIDRQYDQTSKGRDFEACISCELTSTYIDMTTRETDVDWGLYNLRYAFSTCVYGFPSVVTNQTSQCPVACAGVEAAVQLGLMNPSAENFRNWCSSTTFADNVISTCEFCYNLTSEAVNPGTTGAQVYLANFAESIRYNCHFPGIVGEPFDISPTKIFTEVLLPSSLSLTTSTTGSGVNLGEVVGLPIMGFVIILLSLGLCWFFFLSYRRKRALREREQSGLWKDPNSWGWPGGYSDQDAHVQGAAAGYGYGPGFGFVDSDGSGQQVGYSKAGAQQEVTETRTVAAEGLDKKLGV